jgi:uncharacterized membrane-anchored protein
MAKRARKRGRTAWWKVAAIVVAVVLLAWWFHAQRVETPAPPAIKSMLPSIAEPPDGHAHDEITHEEKADLERILREQGAATPGQ